MIELDDDNVDDDDEDYDDAADDDDDDENWEEWKLLTPSLPLVSRSLRCTRQYRNMSQIFMNTQILWYFKP